MEKKLQPLIESFVKSHGGGRWIIGVQFYKFCSVSEDISPTVDARVNASGKTFIIEIEDEEDNNGCVWNIQDKR